MWFNKVITKVRNFVLRVPSKQKLGQLFNQSEWTIPNPVAKTTEWIKMKFPDQMRDDEVVNLQKAIDEADRLAAERSIVLEAVKVIDPKYQEYQREATEERPKFKCKSPNCPEIEMGSCK